METAGVNKSESHAALYKMNYFNFSFTLFLLFPFYFMASSSSRIFINKETAGSQISVNEVARILSNPQEASKVLIVDARGDAAVRSVIA